MNDLPLVVTLLSEDSGQGSATLAALLPRILNVYDRGKPTVSFLPCNDKLANSAASANRWRSSCAEDYSKKVALAKTIATQLGVGGVVVFHFDGDTAWTNRDQSKTAGKFDREVRQKVRQLLVQKQLSEEYLANLIELVPHYSIEAWTYHATQAAVSLCKNHHNGCDADKFEEWGRERHTLDEVLKPKEQTCLGSKYNADLASKIPATEMLAARKSFHQFVARIRKNPLLKEKVRHELIEEIESERQV